MDEYYVIGRPESTETSNLHLNATDDIENNDTIDCLTLPDCEIPYEHPSGVSQLPGTVNPSRMGRQHDHNAQHLRNINTCNMRSYLTHDRALDERGFRCCFARKSALSTVPPDNYERNSLQHTFFESWFDPGMNLNARELRKHSESEILYSSAKDYVEFSNASKKSKQSHSRPNSIARYNRYAFDPPKTPRPCPNSKLAPTSRADTSQGEADNVPRSTVYVTHNQGTLYKVQFHAKNTVLSPLYVNPRYVVQLENEKKVQPDHYAYRDQMRGTDVAAHLVREKYALSTEDQPMKQNKALLPPLRVYTDEMPAVQKRSRSEPERDRTAAATMGSIFFDYKGILLKTSVPVFPITGMRLPIREEIAVRMDELGMPTTESRKNKGTVIGRCGQDLLQFKFDMEGISMNKVELKGSAAVQTEDKMVYIREKSHITGRMLLLALPESTYFYEDPMKTIHRVHINFQRTDIVPLWKYELMKTRLAEKQGSTQMEEKLTKIFQQTRGTKLFFEGLDSLITAQTGLLCCEVSSGKRKYNELIMSYQGQKSQPKRPPQFLHNKALFGDRLGTAGSSKMSAVETGESASVVPENETEQI